MEKIKKLEKNIWLLIFLCIIFLTACNGNSSSAENSQAISAKAVAEQAGITEKQAENLLDLYHALDGYDENFNSPRLTDENTCTINLGTSYTVSFEFGVSEEVIKVYSGSIVFFNDGEIKYLLTDRLVDKEEKSRLKTLIKMCLPDFLVSPKSATFPFDESEWSYAKDEGIYYVKSYVDSQNALGVTLRSHFVGKAKILENGDWNLFSLVINEKEMYS